MKTLHWLKLHHYLKSLGTGTLYIHWKSVTNHLSAISGKQSLSENNPEELQFEITGQQSLSGNTAVKVAYCLK